MLGTVRGTRALCMLEIDYPRVSLHGSLTRTSGGHPPSYVVQIAERSNDDVQLFPPYELYPDHRARACPPLIPPYTILSYRKPILCCPFLSYPELSCRTISYPWLFYHLLFSPIPSYRYLGHVPSYSIL